MLSVKYSSAPIKNLSVETVFNQASALIFKIHVITGWVIPVDDHNAYVNALQDQLRKKLVEDYEDYNFDEIEFAFRQHGTTVKDWGKSFNLNLIDTVMSAYIARRKDISDLEERISRSQEIGYTPTPAEIENGNRELIEQRYQLFLGGSTEISFLPEFGVLQLAADGFCKVELWKDFTKEAIRYKKTELSAERELLFMRGKIDKAKDLADKITELKEMDEIIISSAKKLALKFCFEEFKRMAYVNIYIAE